MVIYRLFCCQHNVLPMCIFGDQIRESNENKISMCITRCPSTSKVGFLFICVNWPFNNYLEKLFLSDISTIFMYYECDEMKHKQLRMTADGIHCGATFAHFYRCSVSISIFFSSTDCQVNLFSVSKYLLAVISRSVSDQCCIWIFSLLPSFFILSTPSWTFHGLDGTLEFYAEADIWLY